MNFSEKVHLLMKNGISVYPEVCSKTKKFAVEVFDEYMVAYKNKKTTGDYKHTTNTINKALEQTVNYLENKIVKFNKS